MNIQDNRTILEPLRHGGNLVDAMQRYGGKNDDWLDLSTGISPWHYPIPNIEPSVWHSLPPKPDSLIDTASDYYKCDKTNLTVTPGSQLAIRLIPSFIESIQTVAVPLIGYQEHEYSWQLAGHSVIHYRNKDELIDLISNRVVQNVVIINPNNPSGETFEANQLRFMSEQLSGLLVVDEAFSDLDSTNSLSSDSNLKNIIVLRSIGKFFGLAGARIGFVITQNIIGRKLAIVFDPWCISAPAQDIAKMALNDSDWQTRQRVKIKSQAIDLNNLLSDINNQSGLYFKHVSKGLFTTIFSGQAVIEALHFHLAEHMIWTRLGDPYIHDSHSDSTSLPAEQNWLRMSLPGIYFDRLSQSLNHIP